MKIINFGIDIDGTVTDPATLVPYLNEAFQLQLTFNDIKAYDLLQVVKVPKQVFNDWYKGKEAEIYEKSILAEGAREILLEWGKDHRLIFISARGKHLLENTEKWFVKNGVNYHHIELVGSHDKLSAAHSHQVDIFFEDKLDNAIDLNRELNIPVILFNTPYNQSPLPEGVIRVQNWQEAKAWVNHWLQTKNG